MCPQRQLVNDVYHESLYSHLPHHGPGGILAQRGGGGGGEFLGTSSPPNILETQHGTGVLTRVVQN